MMRVVRLTVPPNLLVETGLMGRCEGVLMKSLIDVRLFHTIAVFSQVSHYCAEKGELFSGTYHCTHC